MSSNCEPQQEPVAYIEHHKAGDNLVWDNPGGKHTPLYASQPASKPWARPSRLDGMRRAIYDLDCALWRARVAAERNGEQHTQLGHAIDALGRLQTAFGIATPQPDTNGTRSWFTVDELNAWADKYNKAHGIKEGGAA